MAQTEDKQEFSVAYDGTSRVDDHTIDVETLAPALLAMGRLIREANTQFNGKESTAKVLVVSDFEHKCFNVNFEVVLQIFEQIQTLLGDDGVKSAKDLLEWIGLIGTPIVGGFSLLGFLKWRAGREIIEKTTDTDKGIVTVHVKGKGNSVQVTNNVLQLSENVVALKAVRDAFSPVGKDGFDNVKIRLGDTVVSMIDRPEVDAIVNSATVGISEQQAPDETPPDPTPKNAWLSVYSPVFDKSAAQWRFKLGTDVIYADISGTTIAADALARGGASPNDAYNVKLEITEPSRSGRAHYRILDVLRFVPASPTLQQTNLDLQPPAKKPRKRTVRSR